MDDLAVKGKLAENAISLLSDFFSVISDGYNPAVIWTELDLSQEIGYHVVAERFGWNPEGDYFNQLVENKTLIKNVSERLDENFDWCLCHIHTFNFAPKIFESKFHLDNLGKLVDKVKQQVKDLIAGWNPGSSEILIDTRDGSLVRVLFITGHHKTMVIYFGNYIH